MQQKIIEVRGLKGESKIVEVGAEDSVYIANLDESQVILRGKCVKVGVLDVKKSFIVIEGVIANVEVTRARNTTVAVGRGSMINIEQSIECRIATGSEETELRVRRSTDLSLVRVSAEEIAGKEASEIEDAVTAQPEHQIPEEIKVVVTKERVVSSVSSD